MRLTHILIGLTLLGVLSTTCASPGPSITEVLESLEASLNDGDVEAVMALFSEDAILDDPYAPEPYKGLEEIERVLYVALLTPRNHEFRDISIEGASATFIWAAEGSALTKLWPMKVEIRRGKITYMDFYEDATTVSTE